MYRSPKVISEDIDETQLEFAKYEKEARSILANCKAAGRDINASEQRRFDVLCGTAGSRNGLAQQAKQRISQLQNELQQAEENQRQIVMSAHPSGQIYGNRFQDDLVLPMNGTLPGDHKNADTRLTAGWPDQSISRRPDRVRFGQWTRPSSPAPISGLGVSTRPPKIIADRAGLEITNVGTRGSADRTAGICCPQPLASTIIDVRERVGVARRDGARLFQQRPIP